MKRTLIVKDPKARIKVFPSHVEINTFYAVQLVGFNQMTAAYINKRAKLSIGDAIAISDKVPLYFIDQKGNILGRICMKR